MPSPKRGVSYTFSVTFIAPNAPDDFLLGPAIVAGDVRVKVDNGAYANITTLPVSTAGQPDVDVTLSAAEMQATKTTKVWFKDQTVPAEWNPFVVTIEPNGQIVDDIPIALLDVAVSTRAPKGAIGAPGTQGTHTPQIQTLKYRDTLPALDYILHDPPAAGSPPGTVGPVHALPASASYNLLIKLNSGATLIRLMTKIAPDSDGHVRWTAAAADWDTGGGQLVVGRYLTEIEELSAGGGRLTFPNGGYDLLDVLVDLGQGA